MVEKENLAPGVPFESLFWGIRSQKLVALIADTLLFLVVGTLAMVVILTMTLDFGSSFSYVIDAAVILLAILMFALYIAVRRSMKTVKSHGQ